MNRPATVEIFAVDELRPKLSTAQVPKVMKSIVGSERYTASNSARMNFLQGGG